MMAMYVFCASQTQGSPVTNARMSFFSCVTSAVIDVPILKHVTRVISQSVVTYAESDDSGLLFSV